MSKHFVSPEQGAREKALYLYISAFERGDFATMEPILQQAVSDPILDHMITEAHDYFLVEDKIELQVTEKERIYALIFDHFPTSVRHPEEELAIPPLTVDDVIARLQQDPRVSEQYKQEARRVGAQLQQRHVPLPEKLNVKNVYHLFEQVGVAVSSRLQKLFREKAILLSMGHEQGLAQMAATRHQRHSYEQQSDSQMPATPKQKEDREKET